MTSKPQLEASKKWKQANKDKVSAYQKEWRGKNKDKMKQYMQEWREANKENIQEYNSRWKQANPDYSIDKHLKQQYGISIKEYCEMLEKQNFRCAICNTHESEALRSKLFVDHCHSTGKIRSLLCHNCNTALGHTKEDINRLEAMIAYIKEHQFD